MPTHRWQLRGVWPYLLIASLVGAAAWAAIVWTRDTGRIATIWPVNALVLVVLMRTSRRQWPQVLLSMLTGNIAANLVTGDPLIRAAPLALANAVEVLVAAVAVGRSTRLWRRAGLVRFLLATTAACVASTALALLTLLALGGHPAWEGGVIWFMADWLGLIIFAPLIAVLGDRRAQAGLWTRPAVKLVPQFALLAGGVFLAFYQTQYPLLFVAPVLIATMAFGLGLAGSALACLIVAAIAIPMTVAGQGPMALVAGDPATRVLVLQAYLGALTVMSLVLGVNVSESSVLRGRLRAARRRTAERSRSRARLLSQAHMAEELSQVGYWTLDIKTQEVFWSDEVYRIHGVDPETYNPSLGDALDFYPEDRERISRLIDAQMASGEGWRFEATLKAADGALRTVVSKAQCETDASGEVTSIMGVFQDVTEERRVQRAMEESERRYRLLAENVTDVIASYGLDSVFTYLSPSIRVLLGYEPEELVGRSTFEIILEEDADRVKGIFTQAIHSDSPFAVEYRARHKSGAVRWLEARPRFRRDAEGKVIGITDSVRDVTERHEREAALAVAQAQAESATRAKAAFLATMSHEIRTPLNGVLGFADLLGGTMLDADQARFVDRIRTAGRGLSSLIDDILDVSKLEAGKVELEIQSFDIRQLIDEVTALIAAGSHATQVRFSSTVSDQVPTLVRGDCHRIRQILLNLVGNAAKFTRKGSVTLAVQKVADRLRITVADTGCGIAPDRLAAVFSPFSQADSSIGRQFGGSGLGLSISRSLAQLMQGDITLASEPGRGTKATLDIPLIAGDALGMSPAASPESVRSARVLVVDDVDMNRELVGELLARAGHRAEFCTSGPEAIAKVAADPDFDLILMDVEMPRMSGLEASREIRSGSAAGARIPIVALTAHAMRDQIAACRDAGMDDHLAKPLDVDRLLAVVARTVDTSSSGAAPPATGASAGLSDSLGERYAAHLATMPSRLDDLLAIRPAKQRADRLAALAHTLAGTGTSFGYPEVSSAAFELEAMARGGAKLADLRRGVEALKIALPSS